MKITNQKQFEILVAELEKNPSLAKGFYKGHASSNVKGEWEAISRKLNGSGPPLRDADGWQKVWKDLKFKTKKKVIHNKNEANSTGGGIFKQLALSPLEESVANLVQFEKLLNPKGPFCGGVNELIDNAGTEMTREENVESANDIEINGEDNEVQNCAEAKRSAEKKSNKRVKNNLKEDALELLKRQTKLQEEHYNETRKVFDDIKSSLKESERYQRKRFHIKEEKLKLMKIQAKKDDEDRELGRKIKKKKLEILNKELESLNDLNTCNQKT